MKLCKTIQLSPSETRKRNQQKSVTKKSKISVHEKAEKATNKVTLNDYSTSLSKELGLN